MTMFYGKSELRIVTWNILMDNKYKKRSFPLTDTDMTFSIEDKHAQTISVVNRLMNKYEIICLQEVSESIINKLIRAFENKGFNVYHPEYTKCNRHISLIATNHKVSSVDIFKVSDHINITCTTPYNHNHSRCISMCGVKREAIVIHLESGESIATVHVPSWFQYKDAMYLFIRAYIQRARELSNNKVIITGDLNTNYDEYNLRRLMEYFHDMTLAPKRAPTNTPARKGNYRSQISHIISTDVRNVRDIRVIEPLFEKKNITRPNKTFPSDHIPYGVALSLTNSGST